MSKKTSEEFTLHRYKILSVLGRGAMGVVYRAFDPIIERPVAIKVLKKATHLKKVEYQNYLERLFHEARLAGRLNHPAIVMIHDVGEWENVPYIVMEYLEGTTLLSLLKEGFRFPWPEAAKIIRDVAHALDYAHQRGVIHRDIKPSNVMILEDGRVKVLDFGIARFRGDPEETGPYLVGTPGYVAPEIFQRKGALPESDIFSLGVVFYQLLTGKKPFQGNKLATIIHAIMYVTPPPVHELNPEVSPICNTIVQKMLAKDPQQRYRSAAALADDLDRLITRHDRGELQTEIQKPAKNLFESATLTMRLPWIQQVVSTVSQRTGLSAQVILGGFAATILLGFGLLLWATHWLSGNPSTGMNAPEMLISTKIPHRSLDELLAFSTWRPAGPLTSDMQRTLHARFQLGKNFCLNRSYLKCAQIMESILRIQPNHVEARRWLERARSRLEGRTTQ